MAENQSVGINGNTISCLQFTGKCAEALSLYEEVFGTTARHVYKTPDERYVIHASFMFKDKVMIMAWDDALAIKNSCAQRPGMHYLTMDEIQPTHTKALEKGFKQVASMMCPRTDGPDDMFWGDKCVTLQDPYGHLWVLGQKHGQAMDSPEMKASEKAWMALYDGL